MDAVQPLRMTVRQPGGDEGAPVAALGRELLDAEDFRHEARPEIRDLLRVHRLGRRARPGVARQRRADHRETVLGIAAEALGMGQRLDDAVEFEDGARPAMGDEQRFRIGAGAGFADEVNVEPVDAGDVVRPAVELGFPFPPVIAVAPVVHQPAHVGQVCAVEPAAPFRLVRKARPRQAQAQVLQDRVLDIDGEWMRVDLHLGSPPRFSVPEPPPQARPASVDSSAGSMPIRRTAAAHLSSRGRSKTSSESAGQCSQSLRWISCSSWPGAQPA